jgi:hypothetical protein
MQLQSNSTARSISLLPIRSPKQFHNAQAKALSLWASSNPAAAVIELARFPMLRLH